MCLLSYTADTSIMIAISSGRCVSNHNIPHQYLAYRRDMPHPRNDAGPIAFQPGRTFMRCEFKALNAITSMADSVRLWQQGLRYPSTWQSADIKNLYLCPWQIHAAPCDACTRFSTTQSFVAKMIGLPICHTFATSREDGGMSMSSENNEENTSPDPSHNSYSLYVFISILHIYIYI